MKKLSRFDKQNHQYLPVNFELRAEEITDLPRRSSQLNTQLIRLRKESLEKRLAGIQTLTLPSSLALSPIVFFSVLGSAFARLNLFLSKPQNKGGPEALRTAPRIGLENNR